MRSRHGGALALQIQSGVQRARQRSGADTEAFVESLHDVCLRRGVAYVFKRPTPTVGSHGALRYAARAGADYGGWLLDGSGRAVCVEVKRCSERRLLLERIEPHQRDELARAAAARAVSVLLVVYGPRLLGATVHAVPWGLVSAMIENVRRDPDAPRSLGPVELAPWTVAQGTPYLSAAWLLREVVL